jgi:hypothetical protein
MQNQTSIEQRNQSNLIDVPDELLPELEVFGDDSADEAESKETFWNSLPFYDQPLQTNEGDEIGSDDEFELQADVLPFHAVAGNVLVLLDQMTTNKATDTATAQNWAYVQSLLPKDKMCSWPQIKKSMKFHMQKVREIIHVCINMCTLYYNPKNPEFPPEMHNAERTKCNICGEMRYLNGTENPRRIIYYFPVRHWFANLFNDPDIVHMLAHNTAPASFAPGIICSLFSEPFGEPNLVHQI